MTSFELKNASLKLFRSNSLGAGRQPAQVGIIGRNNQTCPSFISLQVKLELNLLKFYYNYERSYISLRDIISKN
jgi:hypothetical protein